MGGFKAKLLARRFCFNLCQQKVKSVWIISSSQLVARSVPAKYSFLLQSVQVGRLLHLTTLLELATCMRHRKCQWPSDCWLRYQLDTIRPHTKWRDTRNLLNYSMLYFLLLTLGKILLVSNIRVCQCNISVKVTLCLGPAKQTFWFGVSCIKTEQSPNPNSCSQAIAVLPAMHGQCGIYRK